MECLVGNSKDIRLRRLSQWLLFALSLFSHILDALICKLYCRTTRWSWLLIQPKTNNDPFWYFQKRFSSSRKMSFYTAYYPSGLIVPEFPCSRGLLQVELSNRHAPSSQHRCKTCSRVDDWWRANLTDNNENVKWSYPAQRFSPQTSDQIMFQPMQYNMTWRA